LTQVVKNLRINPHCSYDWDWFPKWWATNKHDCSVKEKMKSLAGTKPWPP